MSQEPSPADVERYAERAGVPVDEETAAAFAEQFAQQDQLLADLDALEPPEPPERDHWEPTEEDDPLAAFLTRCDVEGGSGPLDGMTVGVKDNLAVAGIPMTCGSPVLESYVPEFDATVVERLLDAGARVVGKTNMDELAFGGEEATMRFRLAGNPHDPDRHPGSSSAGSGIAAATGEVDLAVGSDTGGSIRFPAAWSGTPGIKPTRGSSPTTASSSTARPWTTSACSRRRWRTSRSVSRRNRRPRRPRRAHARRRSRELRGCRRVRRREQPGGLTIGLPGNCSGTRPRWTR